MEATGLNPPATGVPPKLMLPGVARQKAVGALLKCGASAWSAAMRGVWKLNKQRRKKERMLGLGAQAALAPHSHPIQRPCNCRLPAK